MFFAAALKLNNVALAAGSSVANEGAKSIFTNPTWDVLIIVIFIAASFFYALLFGKNRVILGILVSYFTFSLWQVLPIFKISQNIGEGEGFALKIALFFALYTFIFVLSGKSSVVPGFKIRKEKFTVMAKTFLFSFLQIGFFLNIIFSFLPVKGNFEISPIINFLFYSDYSSVFWVAMPIIAIIVLRRKEKIL